MVTFRFLSPFLLLLLLLWKHANDMKALKALQKDIKNAIGKQSLVSEGYYSQGTLECFYKLRNIYLNAPWYANFQN